MLEKEIPLRGAIAHGSLTRTKTKNGGVFVAGKPIVDAYRFETVQNWLGVMVAPSVLKKVPNLDKRRDRDATQTWRNPRSLTDRKPWARARRPLDRGDARARG